ncbi:dephospho-CoA kinase [Kwoniella pini CBS 10737]|uniref:Dephospho-CoA kinase n=1 Tax=Kwoniella pini CBS 10737 TaxID=1296096 RepID=A0A1B9IDH0_9TREE|nr:dephospho-CoA kinase [Kwoniella pini CBS 10737]OCF53563.1 dephospho-CoA kinase [Kwoniella pini CBS 10737]
MLIVGLTGGIASGKSTVSKIFNEKYNIPIIDADLISRQVIEPDTKGYKLILKHFGKFKILNNDSKKTINRIKLGEIIFNNNEKRNLLNSLLHPLIKKEIFKKVLFYWLIKGEWCIILDIPLLIESGIWKFVGEIIIVYVNEKLQLSRLLSRNSLTLSEEQAKSRINSQMSLKLKLNYSTFIIDNSGSINDLNLQIEKFILRLKKSQGFGFKNSFINGWWYKLCWILPPIGLISGLLVLFKRWLKYSSFFSNKSKKQRRRGRGEIDNSYNQENIELREINQNSNRRRTESSISGNSILD